MYKTIRILTILAAMIVGAGQAWAEDGVKYIDENGTEQTCSEYTVLTGGGETTLDGGWYVVNSDITYTGKITLNGNMHLILCDGAKMNVGSSESRINDTGIDGLKVSSYVTIYGQSTGDDMGTLSIYTGGSNSGDGICSEFLTINGGHIIANTDRFRIDALFAQCDFTINGGTVEATATGPEGDAIHAGDSFHYAGGIVTTAATGYAFYANRGYNFTWRNPTDRVTIGSTGLFTPNQFTVTDGKRFVAYNDAEGPAASAVLGSTGGLAANDLAGKTLRPLAVSETVGGVTTTYPGYCLTVPAGTVVSGKTEADGTTPKPDFTIGGKPYFTYKTGDNVAFTLEDRGQDGVEVSGLPIDLAVTERIPTINFQMRTDDVNVTAKFYLQQKGIDYLDWDVDKGKLVAKNTKDLSPIPKVYMLDGREKGFGKDGEETWHVCTTAATENDGKGLVYTGEQIFSGTHVHLILADGAAMTSEGRLYGNVSSFTIHGQSDNEETMGRLTVTTTNNTDGIFLNGFTVNGGIVEAASYYNRGIISNAVTINGGRVKAFGYSGINSNAVTIKGGQVEIHGTNYGFIGVGITLSWTSASDYIKARSYNGSVTISDGYYFTYEDNTGDPLTGAIDDFSTLAGKKLIPALKKVMEGDTYIAYSSGNGNWKLSGADAQVYVITGYDLEKGVVLLEPVTGNEIPDGVPVIIGNKTDGASLPDNFWLVGEQQLSTDAAGSITGALKNFVAGDGQTTMQDFIDAIAGSTGTPVGDYVAFILEDGRFKPVIMNATAKPTTGACLLILSKADLLTQAIVGASSAARTLTIDLGDATGIVNSEERIVNSEQGAWYSLDGRKLSGRPTAKGIYIHHGRTFVVQ